MQRLMIVAALLVAHAAPVHAQMTKGVQAILQTAATVCVEWASGRADFSKKPPPRFRAANPLERIAFNIGAGAFGEEVEGVWVHASGRPVVHWVLGFEAGCVVYSLNEIAPVDIDLMRASFNKATRRFDPDAPELEFYSIETDTAEATRMVYHVLDTFPDLMVGIQQGWRDGKTTRGRVMVIVRQW